MAIDQELKEYALSLGAELYGVASAADYTQEFPAKPQPTAFVKNARSVVVLGLPFEPGTVATVLRPELAGLRARAADAVTAGKVQPAGAELLHLHCHLPRRRNVRVGETSHSRTQAHEIELQISENLCQSVSYIILPEEITWPSSNKSSWS